MRTKNFDWKEGDQHKHYTLSTQILKQSFTAVLRKNCFSEKLILKLSDIMLNDCNRSLKT